MVNRGKARIATRRRSDVRPPGRAADNGLGIGETPRGYGQGLRAVFDPQTGLGTDMRATRFVYPRILDHYELTALGMDGLAQRVITYPVTRALACGYEIVFDKAVPENIREKLMAAANNVAKRIGVDAWAALLGVRARWYGDAIAGISFESDQDEASLSSPPAWGQRVRWLTVWDVRDFYPINYEGAENSRYRRPAWLRLMTGRPLLESERWYGYRTGTWGQVPLHPRRYVRLHTISGFSVFQAIAPYYVSLLQSSQGASNLMQRASLGHFRIKDWADMVRSRGAEAQAILQAQYAAMSTANVVVTDGVGDDLNEDFEQISSTVSGVDAGVFAAAYLFSAASGIPLARLLGTSPGAFQSGELQDNMWYELLGELQAWLEPALRWFWDAVFAEVLGVARAPEYELRWKSPRVVSDTAQVELRGKALDIALKALSANLITPDSAIAALNSDSPADFQYALPEADMHEIAAEVGPELGQVEPTAPAPEAAPPVEPAAEEAGPLSEVALNGAQVQSLVGVATDPLLTSEQKEAIISASFPTIPLSRVKTIAAGGLVAPPGPAVAPVGGPATTPAPGTDQPEDAPEDAKPDVWRTGEQIAELFGAVTPDQLKRHAASAPQTKEPGKLTWIKTGRGRLYKLSEVEARWAIAGDDLEIGTADDPAPAATLDALAGTESFITWRRDLSRRRALAADGIATGKVPEVLYTCALSGQYAQPALVGGWKGWIVRGNVQIDGIAFVHTDGTGLWWAGRDDAGGVQGEPIRFVRAGAQLAAAGTAVSSNVTLLGEGAFITSPVPATDEPLRFGS